MNKTKASEHKTLPFIVTKIDGDQGVVEHTVAVMGNVDLGGDRIHNGAFTKTILERAGKIRVLDAHNSNSVMSVIGKPLALWEAKRDELPVNVRTAYPDATGALMARTQFLMDTPEGKGAFARIRDGAVDEYSIGYDPITADYTEEERGGKSITVRNLKEIRLWEYSPVAFAMNPATSTLSAKADKQTAIDNLTAFLTEATQAQRADLWLAWVERTAKRALEQSNSDTADPPRYVGKEDEPIGGGGGGGRDKYDSIAVWRGEAWNVKTAPLSDGKELGPDGKPIQRLGDVLTGSIHRIFTVLADDFIVDGLLSQDQRRLMSGAIGAALDILNERIPPEIMQIQLNSNAMMPSFFLGGGGGGRDNDEAAPLSDEKIDAREVDCKSVNLSEQLRALVTSFYNAYPDSAEYVYWVCEMWDDHLIVQKETAVGETYYRVPYTLFGEDSAQSFAFALPEQWTEIEQVWIPVGEKRVAIVNNYYGTEQAKDAPALEQAATGQEKEAGPQSAPTSDVTEADIDGWIKNITALSEE